MFQEAAAALSSFPHVFEVSETAVTLRDKPEWLDLDEESKLQARTLAVGRVLRTLRDEGNVPMLYGWRDEAFAVRPSFYAPPALVIERAAGPLFGLPSFGCFTNGYICMDGSDRPTHLWLGRRSRTKPTWPGLLDCIAAGGIAAGQSVSSAMVRECAEEAGISDHLSSRLRSSGGVSYTGFNEDGWGIKSDVLFTFDLRLPEDFTPVPVDGEMEEFMLLSIDEVSELLACPQQQFKPNVGVIIVDFLVRHGFVSPDDDGYIELLSALRSGVSLVQASADSTS